MLLCYAVSLQLHWEKVRAPLRSGWPRLYQHTAIRTWLPVFANLPWDPLLASKVGSVKPHIFPISKLWLIVFCFIFYYNLVNPGWFKKLNRSLQNSWFQRISISKKFYLMDIFMNIVWRKYNYLVIYYLTWKN